MPKQKLPIYSDDIETWARKYLEKHFLSSCKIDILEDNGPKPYQFIFQYILPENGKIEIFVFSRPKASKEEEKDVFPLLKRTPTRETPNLKILGLKKDTPKKRSQLISLTGRWSRFYCRLLVFKKPPTEEWTEEDEKTIRISKNELLI
jgi:hypothetical protein